MENKFVRFNADLLLRLKLAKVSSTSGESFDRIVQKAVEDFLSREGSNNLKGKSAA